LDRILAEFKTLVWKARLNHAEEPGVIQLFHDTYGVDPRQISTEERRQVLNILNNGLDDKHLDLLLHRIRAAAAAAKASGKPPPKSVEEFTDTYGVDPLGDLSEADREKVIQISRDHYKLSFADLFVLARKPFFSKQIRANPQHTANLGMCCGGYS